MPQFRTESEGDAIESDARRADPRDLDWNAMLRLIFIDLGPTKKSREAH